MIKKGLAQIPLMIVLLIIALAVPIATKLVKENQDTRNLAVGTECGGVYATCPSGYYCSGGICKEVVVTPTTPSCVGLRGSCATQGCCAGLNCFLGTCMSEIGPINPSVTPIPRICNPGATNCRDTNSVEICNSNGTAWSLLRSCAYGCSNGDCKAAPPTATPNPCSITTGRANNCTCTYNNQCASGNCAGSTVCLPMPTVTPTVSACIATSGQYCANSSTSCTDKGNSIVTGSCAGAGYVCCKSVSSATPTLACNSETCVLYCATNGMKATCGNNGICVCSVIPTVVPSTPTPISNPGGPIVTNPPGDDSMCPGAEACPHSETDLLRNCTPADADGTSKDYRCNADTVGKRDPCGGKEYCCPSTGGAWTLDMTNCPTPINLPTTCTQCAGNPDAKLKGDADCSGSTNLNDFSIWRREFDEEGNKGTVSQNTWNADFDCDGKVTLNDYSIWRPIYTSYIKGLLNN